ncbi:MAG: hypothetical protein KAG97_10530 [Victivallales bacterium]|nr:hypothetical protein [Victivallales bacterium]
MRKNEDSQHLLVGKSGAYSGTRGDSRNKLKLKRFVEELERSVDAMDDIVKVRAVDNIMNSDLLNTADVALALADSKNVECAKMGRDLMANICISRPEHLRPNKFLVAFAKLGMESNPRIARMIDETNDDFAREWACELYVEIYFHNTQKSNSRHKELAAVKKREREIYDFARDIALKPGKLAEIAKRGGRPDDTIREQWGDERRYPLKMLAILRSFELLAPYTAEAVAGRVSKIVDVYDLRYDILGRIGGKIVERPHLPVGVRLRMLASAVFKDKYHDTDEWIPRKEGGFTTDELEYAVESGDLPEMRRMMRVLRRIVGDVLRAKLVLGLGNLEIGILRHFDHAVWGGKQFRWSYKALTIVNDSGKDLKLRITRVSNASGEKLKEIERLTLFRHGKFVWFSPEGRYIVEPDYDVAIPFRKTPVSLLTRDFTLVLRKRM